MVKKDMGCRLVPCFQEAKLVFNGKQLQDFAHDLDKPSDV